MLGMKDGTSPFIPGRKTEASAWMADPKPPRPKRRNFPLMLKCSLLFWLACALAYLCMGNADAHACSKAFIASTALCVAFLLCSLAGLAGMRGGKEGCHAQESLPCQEGPSRHLKLKPLAVSVPLLIAFACMGASAGSFGSLRYHEDAILAAGKSGEMSFQLESDSKDGDFGSSAKALCCDKSGSKHKVQLNFEGNDRLYAGQTIRASTSLREISAKSKDYCYQQGIVAACSIGEYDIEEGTSPIDLIHAARIQAVKSLGEHGGPTSSLLQALVCGYRCNVEESGLYDSFKICGLAHMIAVSGAHLAIVTAVFNALLKMLRLPRWASTLLCSLFIASYLVFAGMPISAMRAAAMVCLSMTSFAAKRRSASLSALGLCIIGFTASDPPSSISASLALSAGSTLGIMLFADLFRAPFKKASHNLDKIVGAPLSLTLAANIATMPYSAAAFGTLSLVAPLANVIAAPLFTIACASGLLASISALLFPSIAQYSIGAASIAAKPLEAFAEAASEIPHASMFVDVGMPFAIVFTIAACAVLWMAWPAIKLSYYAAAAIPMAAAAATAFAFPHVTADMIAALDVGQGDAILIRSGSHSVLVDTGNQDKRIASELADCGVTSLDAVVITHPDDDHCGSLPYIASHVEIDSVVVAEDLLECGCGKCKGLALMISGGGICKEVKTVELGDSLAFGNMTLEVLWPRSYDNDGGNGDSLCLQANVDCDGDGSCDWSALLTGDAESKELEQIGRDGNLKDVDVLKVGHHGSSSSVSSELLQTLKPEIALISVGEGNAYGHPSKEALEALEKSRCRICRTDALGRITVSFSMSGINVEYAHGQQGKK